MPKDTSKAAETGKMALSMTLKATSSSRVLTASARTVSSKTKVTKLKAQVQSTLVALKSPVPIDIEQRLEHLEEETMGESWFQALKPEFGKAYFRKLKTFLLEEHRSHTVYPPLKDVYSWSILTPLDEVKVVVLGQDPYHNVGQAHGLSFSVLPPTKPPGSLKNIYKQLAVDYPEFVSPTAGHGTFSSARTKPILTKCFPSEQRPDIARRARRALVEHEPHERNKEANRGIVFMAWGLPAQKTCAKIGIDEVRAPLASIGA
ncbi:hypothetical protein H0H87_000117 [Tephrocybe sp. NHM501043]|nr:hypothetical protein H0H87_000117 [Tephrocybe sp. NHM501043]